MVLLVKTEACQERECTRKRCDISECRHRRGLASDYRLGTERERIRNLPSQGFAIENGVGGLFTYA